MFLALLLACDPEPEDTDTDADTDTESGTPETGDTDTAPERFPVIEFYQGYANLIENTWSGEEALLATSEDGTVEYCRVTNPSTGTASALRCAGCDFTFDVEYLPGTATGDHCAEVRLDADINDGERWTLGFSSFYVYDDVEFSNVLLFAYTTTDGYTWRPFATGELASGRDHVVYWTDTYPSYYYGL